jgi:hypothetical protein
MIEVVALHGQFFNILGNEMNAWAIDDVVSVPITGDAFM